MLFHNWSPPVIPNTICIRIERLIIILYCTVIVFTSLLFFLRIRAVFERNPWVVAFFACSWLAVLGNSLSFIVNGVQMDTSLNSSATCLNKEVNPFLTASTIISMINDTLVFLAITWRLFRNSYVPHTLRSGIRLVILGDYLPKFSKAFLKDGQAYYLLAPFLIYLSCLNWLQLLFFHRIIVTMNVIQVIMILLPSNPNVLKLILSVPIVVLMNVMACRVFRNTLLFASGTEVSTAQIQEI